MDQKTYSRERVSRPAGLSFRPAAGFIPASVSQAQFAAEQTAGGLPEFFAVLVRNRGLLIACAAIGVVLGVGFSLLQRPLYQSHTALEIQNPNLDFLNTRQVNPEGDDPSTDNGLTDIMTQIQIIQSDKLTNRVIHRLRAEGKIAPLEQQVTAGSSLLHPLIHRLMHRSKLSPDDLDYAMQQQVERNLTVKQIGPTRAVEILYTSTDPKFAATLVNTVASEYIESSMEDHWNKSKQTEEWLSAQLEEMRTRLQQSENALQAYATSSGLLFATPAGNSAGSSDISGSRLSQLQTELSAAQNDRVSAQSHYEIARSAKPADLPDILNDSQLRELEEKLTDLERQRAELLTTYTDENERVRKVEAQIPPLEAAYAAQRSAILNRIHEEYAMALRREKLLTTDYQVQANVVIDKTNKGIQYGILKRQVDSNQQLYDSMLEQVKRAGIASTIHASNIQVFDPATPSRRPFAPNPPLDAALGLFGGTMAGVLFTFFSDRGYKTLHGPGELQNKTGLRELGVIPDGWAELNARTGSRRLLASGRAPNTPPNLSASTLGLFEKKSHKRSEEHSMELLTWSQKPSFTAESFRALLTSILFADERGSRPQTIVLTSANAMEGKTTLTCNLGIAMANVQKRVLVIDADLRNPRIHTIFNLENDCGLSTLLSRPFPVTRPDLNVKPTFVPGLFVLPAGPANEAAANLFHSPRLKEILSRLRQHFDTVIIDTPPCLLASDARVIGRLSDAVILVVRAGRTPWEEAQVVVQQFEQDRTRVLGTVLNCLKMPGRDYAYYRASS